MGVPQITILLCTRSPRPSFLRRTIDSLRAQTLPVDRWALRILDNASHPPLGDEWRPGWHPNGVLERVDTGGKTSAIRHGLSRVESDLVCTVDDDNVLRVDYLERAVAAFEKHPRLGVAGGRIHGELGAAAADGLERYLAYLAIRDFGDRARVSTEPGLRRWTPCGAGMVLRRDALAAALGRIAPIVETLHSGRGDDTCIALDVAAQGFATAYLPQLELTHLIPPHRLRPDYIEMLIRISTVKVTAFQIRSGTRPAMSTLRQIAKNLLRGVYHPTPAGRMKRRMERARRESRNTVARSFPDVPRILRELEEQLGRLDGRQDEP